jgi:hypothetical protein
MQVASCSNVVLEAQVRSAARLWPIGEEIRANIKPAIKRALILMVVSLMFERNYPPSIRWLSIRQFAGRRTLAIFGQ